MTLHNRILGRIDKLTTIPRKIRNSIEARKWACKHCAILLEGFYQSGSWPILDENDDKVFQTEAEENRIMRAVKGVIIRLHKEADEIGDNHAR
jgi:hypothetical protein